MASLNPKFFILLYKIFKPIVLFPSALYLLGFSLNGVNFYGSIDALIPFERAVSLLCSIGLFAWFTGSCIEIWKLRT